MSTNSHFHVMKNAKFSKELLNDLQNEINNNKKLISGYVLEDDLLLINLNHSNFETIFVTTNFEKTFFKIEFPDGSMYSGFKYRNGKHNVFAFKIMLILKYHLKENIIILSEDLIYGLSNDFITALNYIREELNYNIAAEPREENTAPRIYINNEEVANIYDEDGNIFNSMFKVVSFK